MAKQMVRVALCVAVVLVGGLAWAGGDRDEKKDGPTVKTMPTEKGKASKIHVYVPSSEAKLYFDDTLTKETGKDRTFNSPALEDGKRYTYKIVCRWVENGREVMHETRIDFTAGQDVCIDFRR
jgi:uncharacterized protein (TIGR03000 family)